MSTTLGLPFARAWLALAADAMRDHRVELIELDRAIGDGDHGENMDRGFTAVRTSLPMLEDAAGISGALASVAMTLMSTVGGAAGPLYGTAFLRAGRAVGEEVDAEGIATLLRAAADGIASRGKAEPGEKTMVDAWMPAAHAAREAADAGASPTEVWQAAARAAREGAKATIPLVATKGRASYLGERSMGHQDPGATSSALLLEAAARAATEGPDS
ncbi:MAG: dihydroxyacetone kinase subunit DhaL [Bowdeniella nasicola]|nr:dihydroxyacetone kinase subunit DhaL [Bowdeniella nasicola]